MSRVSQDFDENLPMIIAAGAEAITRSSNIELLLTPSIPSRDPAESIAELIEQQVKREHQQIEASIQNICPSRPDPLIATKHSTISNMTTNGIPPPSPLLPSLDLALPTELQGILLPFDTKLL